MGVAGCWWVGRLAVRLSSRSWQPHQHTSYRLTATHMATSGDRLLVVGVYVSLRQDAAPGTGNAGTRVSVFLCLGVAARGHQPSINASAQHPA